ncbi:glycosyltransferase family 9 protein [Candidatus Woesearchaeota archaeon]|nr:glycosyltransferase family 9 protein [Candidatus Woesearchaeota archaeon]
MCYRKILILNLIPNTIGDNILITPMLNILKKNFPQASLDLTVSKLNGELFYKNENINKLYEIDELKEIADGEKNKFQKFGAFLKILLRYPKIFRTQKYDLCIMLLPNFPLNVLIPVFSGIKERIGYTTKYSFLSLLLTKKTEYRGILETKDYERHFVESYLDLLRLINLKWKKDNVVCKMNLSEKEIKEVEKILKKNKLSKNKYVCFQTRSKGNPWPIERFSELAIKIIKKTNLKIVLLGSKIEFEINQEIASRSANIINLCTNTSLRTKAALLKLAAFSVCNDSGLAHVSSSVGTKTIVLYGPHSPKHSRPLGKGQVYVIYKGDPDSPYAVRGSQKGMELINRITVDDVLKVSMKLAG